MKLSIGAGLNRKRDTASPHNMSHTKRISLRLPKVTFTLKSTTSHEELNIKFKSTPAPFESMTWVIQQVVTKAVTTLQRPKLARASFREMYLNYNIHEVKRMIRFLDGGDKSEKRKVRHGWHRQCFRPFQCSVAPPPAGRRTQPQVVQAGR